MDDVWGGPLAQADFAGSGIGFFGADAVEDLLILQRDITDLGKEKEKKEQTNCCKITCNELILISFFLWTGCQLVINNELPAVDYGKQTSKEGRQRSWTRVRK